MAHRACLNCGADLGHRGTNAKTCSTACRVALHRKQAAAAAIAGVIAEAPAAGTNPISAVTATKRAVEREVRELVKPVVREALTEDVLGALQDLVRLTPDAVQTLADHMHGEDPVLAQKAATTVMRYTVGHTALVTPQEATAPQLVVNFDLPRPGPDATPTEDPASDAVEVFECDVCHEVQPISQRVGSSERCHSCHEARKHAILEQYGLEVTPS